MPRTIATFNNCTLTTDGEFFIMDGPSGRHTLACDCTDQKRLAAHWSGFSGGGEAPVITKARKARKAKVITTGKQALWLKAGTSGTFGADEDRYKWFVRESVRGEFVWIILYTDGGATQLGDVTIARNHEILEDVQGEWDGWKAMLASDELRHGPLTVVEGFCASDLHDKLNDNGQG